MKKLTQKAMALLLVMVTVLSMVVVPAGAASISDGKSTTVTIKMGNRHTYLTLSNGNTLGGEGWTYTTNDGIQGPGYCINWGLKAPSSTKQLTIAGRYTSNPKTTGAFANGYPQQPLDTFLELNADVSALNGLTVDEYMYATQVAVWSTLGQLAVEGTSFTAGRATLKRPSGDAQKVRVFTAIERILAGASSWTKLLNTGMYVRAEDTQLGGDVSLPAETSLEDAVVRSLGGIKKETINGTPYYTRSYTGASATSTYFNNYCIDVWAENAPTGTIFTDMSNSPLETATVEGRTVYKLPTTYKPTNLNTNGSEYSGQFKICLPADNVASSGNVTIRIASAVKQFDIYLVNNPASNEQSYIVADPTQKDLYALGSLKWNSIEGNQDQASITVNKIDGTGNPLEGAKFTLEGTDGSTKTGTTDFQGKIEWTELDPAIRYTVKETEAPAGYRIVDPVNVTVTAGQTSYVTVTNSTEHQIKIRKLDSQNSTPLQGAIFSFKQIDGGFQTTGITGHDGMITFNGKDLPYGSYEVSEVQAPQGYWPDTRIQTVDWNGSADVTLTFRDVRKPGFVLIKTDTNGVSLAGAVFNVYKDGQLITTATVNNNGMAFINGLEEGYYEVEEIVAPPGFALDSTRHGIHIDPYNPATTDDPVLTVANKVKPSLRILKYDLQTMSPLPNCVFEVYRDTELIGSYTTDSYGEILLSGLTPGTYLVKEVAAAPGYVVNSTPQQIELRAGENETTELIFLNSLKPGIHLVKLDSSTMKPLVNATYVIKKVGGSFIQEFTTDINGEINLTALEPGAYTVEEVKAPTGYLIDDHVRTVQINPDENAIFVFTDTKKPSFELVKFDPVNSLYLGGATFRIAKIEDGSHYLDRITDVNGRIRIDDLDPGIYSVQEIAPPSGYILNDREHHVELFPGKTSQIVIENVKKPSLIVWKYDEQTAKPLPDTEFSIAKKGGGIIYEGMTNSEGFIRLDNLDEGWYTITEMAPPPGYLPSTPPVKDVYLYGGATIEVKFDDLKCPTLTVNKVDRDTLEPLSAVRFNVKFSPNINFNGGVVDLGEYVTDKNGQIILDDNLKSGWYRVTELAPPPGYVFGGPATKDIFLAGGENKVLIFENIKKPSLIIWKYDLQTTEKLPNAEFSIRHKDGAVVFEGITDAEGKILLTNLEPGYYTITEIAPPPGYLLASPASRDVYLEEGKTLEVKFDDLKCPTLTVLKLDSITHDPIKNVRFNIKFSPNVNFTGGVIDMGNFTTGGDGRILLNNNLQSGWYRVTEVEAPAGYIMKEPVTQDIFLKGGDNVTLTFENIPKSALIIHKTDLSGQPVAGATFEVRYLAGTSGSGGTLIKTVVTSANGTATLTGLSPGAYVVEETIPAPGYQLANPSVQTAYITDSDQCVVELHFGNPKMGHLVLVKLDSATKLPVAGVTFLVTDSSGAVIGPNNGEFTTDATGVIEITEWLTIGSTVNIKEIRCPDNYNMDAPAQSVKIMENTTHRLTFYDSPKSGLQVIKTASGSKTGLKDAHFRLYKASGEVVGDYVTDKDGLIIVPTLEPGWYKLVETKAPAGYVLDDKPIDVQITNNQFVRVEVENKALSGLLITKYAKGTSTKQTLAGAVFQITDSEGKVVGSANGRFTTDAKGQILVSGLLSGTYIVTEVTAPSGYRLDPTPQTISIKAGEGLYALDFYNDPIGGIEIQKIDEETRKPIPNTEFSITKMNGERISANTYITDAQGIIRVYGLDDGWYTVTEVKAAEGYRLDPTPHNVEVKNGQATPLRLTNSKESSILLHKIDSVTGKGIYGVKFLISDANSNPLKTVETDQNGYIYTTGLSDGKYFIREIEAAPGYILDSQTKTFYISYGSTTEITWKNTPVVGQIQITKKSADDNPINGFPAGTLLADAVFEVYDRAGNKVDTIRTDKNGWAATKPLPIGRYTIRETQAPAYYSATQDVIDAEIEFSNQIVRVTVLNKSTYTNVSVTKRGYTEVVPGQSIRYDFKNIANNSTVALDGFYWRDTLPTDAVRLDKIVTGTWSAKLSYKIVYKTNLSGGNYRTLSDNLSTEKVHTIAASPAALGLAANEYVTEVMFVFGRVPAGFKQVEAPYIFCNILPNLAHEYRFTNKTDVGGLWGNQWIMANDRWVSVVYNKTTQPQLPRTGY